MTLRSLSHTVSTAARRESSKALAWAAETLPICFTFRDTVVLALVSSGLAYLLYTVIQVRASLKALLPPLPAYPDMVAFFGVSLLAVGVLFGACIGYLFAVAEARLKAARAVAATAPAGEAAP